jgi:hypothetical protein
MTLSDQWLQFAPKPPELTGDQKWHVFLSYRSVHRPWVIQLYDVLRHLGFEVFLDQYVLAASSTLISGLADGLEKSASGILVSRPATQDSGGARRVRAMESGNEKQITVRRYRILDRVDLPFWASQKNLTSPGTGKAPQGWASEASLNRILESRCLTVQCIWPQKEVMKRFNTLSISAPASNRQL